MTSTPNLDRLEALARRATPGPWRWSGYANANLGGVRLDAMLSGRPTVMCFRRWGMRSAEPTFWDRSAIPFDDRRPNAWCGGRFTPARDVAVREVTYRDDVVDLDTPDAQWIAAVDPTTVLALIARIRELEARS